MEEWGTRLLSPQRRTENWLHGWNGESVTELYPLFVQRLKDPDWCTAIEHAVYWSVRSDASQVGPDGGCILLQTTFERLAWQVLVIDKRSLSEEGFSRMQAADQVRLLLSACSIPLDIPPHLIEIQKAAKERNWRDGPQAFVETRNRLVHPPKKAGKSPGDWPTNEVYDLGKLYLDLLILSLCGYKGLYSDRTKPRHVRVTPDRVPWAS
jgi:hypothetical protein